MEKGGDGAVVPHGRCEKSAGPRKPRSDDFVNREEKCELRKKLFSICSYCSGRGARFRCGECGWVYCKSCMGKERCGNCADKRTFDSLPADARKISIVNKVVIVGAGIGGLAAALGLKRRGVEQVVVLERASELRTLGGGINCQPNAMKALLDLDPLVMDQVSDAGALLNGVGGFTTKKNKILLEYDFLSPILERWGNPSLVNIVRGDLQKILFDRCQGAGVKFLFDTTVVSVKEEQHQVILSMKDGSKLEADFVVGADGIWSKVRQSVFPTAPMPTYNGCQIFVGIAELGRLDSNVANRVKEQMLSFQELWGKGSRFGYFNLENNRATCYFFRNARKQKDAGKSSDELQQILIDKLKADHYPQFVQDLVQAMPLVTLVDSFTLPRLANHVSEGGKVLLLGDAANASAPTLGQMGCMAMESASILSQMMLVSDSLRQATQKYEKRRVKRCNMMRAQSKLNNQIFSAGNIFTASLRDTAFWLFDKYVKCYRGDPKDAPDLYAWLFSYRLMKW